MVEETNLVSHDNLSSAGVRTVEHGPNYLFTHKEIDARVEELIGDLAVHDLDDNLSGQNGPITVQETEQEQVIDGHSYGTRTVTAALNGFKLAETTKYLPSPEDRYDEDEPRPTVDRALYGTKDGKPISVKYTAYKRGLEASLDHPAPISDYRYQWVHGDSDADATHSSKSPFTQEVQKEIADTLGIKI